MGDNYPEKVTHKTDKLFNKIIHICISYLINPLSNFPQRGKVFDISFPLGEG